MHVALSKRESYLADIYCIDVRSAKQVLRENYVSLLAIDFYLQGRDTGEHFLAWAHEKALLPRYIVVTEIDRHKRNVLSQYLSSSGYTSPDNMTFIKQ